ncbi:MAG TPA: hypothetical protein VJ741_05305 [Solirubrobacteraceae bacterium]|nr:hypothetical protein [Solirubrobacteraceae bacterium]
MTIEDAHARPSRRGFLEGVGAAGAGLLANGRTAMTDGITLGPVGGRIVTETLLGLLRADPTSYLSVYPRFTPFLDADLALGPISIRRSPAAATTAGRISSTTRASSLPGATAEGRSPFTVQTKRRFSHETRIDDPNHLGPATRWEDAMRFNPRAVLVALVGAGAYMCLALLFSSPAGAATSPCSDTVTSAPTSPATVSATWTPDYGRVLVVGSGAYQGCSLYLLTSDQLQS